MKQHIKQIFLLFVLFISVFGNANAQIVRYKGLVEGHYIFSDDDFVSNQILTTTSHGVALFNNRLFVGAGIGIGVSTPNTIKTYNVPIFTDVRYNILNSNKVRPFVATKIGYGALWDEEHDGGSYTDGGLFIVPSFGVSLPLSHRNEFFVSVGYTYHEATAEYWDFGFIGYNIEEFNAGGICLSAGFSF